MYGDCELKPGDSAQVNLSGFERARTVQLGLCKCLIQYLYIGIYKAPPAEDYYSSQVKESIKDKKILHLRLFIVDGTTFQISST